MSKKDKINKSKGGANEKGNIDNVTGQIFAENQNQNHNKQKEALGPNTRR